MCFHPPHHVTAHMCTQEYAPQYPHVVAVVDPPRAGLHKDVLLALLACPAIKRLVFVSCNPDSLVLNSKLLCGRYRPDINAPKGECWALHAVAEVWMST